MANYLLIQLFKLYIFRFEDRNENFIFDLILEHFFVIGHVLKNVPI